MGDCFISLFHEGASLAFISLLHYPHTGSEMRMILLHYFSCLGFGLNLPIHASCEDLITAEAGVVLLPAQMRYYFLPLLSRRIILPNSSLSHAPKRLASANCVG